MPRRIDEENSFDYRKDERDPESWQRRFGEDPQEKPHRRPRGIRSPRRTGIGKQEETVLDEVAELLAGRLDTLDDY